MTDAGQIIFVDDEGHVRRAVQQTLELAGFDVACCDNAADALRRLSPDYPGIVICDIKMPGMDGIGLMRAALAIDRELPVILVTGHGDVATAVAAMHEGAYDFLEKPCPPEQLTEVARRALDKRTLTLENRGLRRQLDEQGAPGPRLIGQAPAMKQLRALIARVADTDADVLVCAETGTGKELVARSLHEQSRRRSGNFVAVNCGAMPEHLIESELFGHESGAFTGARGRRVGKIEHASGGTLFLDEIESMPTAMQVRLLRVLQERSVERLGANEPIALDLRVVAATKVDLRQAADRGEFRDDLYYRLNVVTIDIPPLRERREDIPLLFHHFKLVAGTRYGRDTPALTPEQLSVLMARDWPGNVRELRNAAERYVLLYDQHGYDVDHLMQVANDNGAPTLREQVDSFEKSLIEQALKACKGNISEATHELGMPRKTLHDKIRKHGLDRHHYG